LSEARKLSNWNNFNSKFVTHFEMIPAKIVASNIELPQKNNINFEGQEVHLFNF
jgi:hypothetical protein